MANKDLPPQLAPTEQERALDYNVRLAELQAQLDPGKLARFASAASLVNAAVDAGVNVVNAVASLKKAVDTLHSSHEEMTEFGERRRSLELVLVNATRRRLVLDKIQFNSGSTFYGPTPVNVLPVDTIDPAGATLWTVANSRGAFMIGVSGSAKWRLSGTPFSLALGFTNPQFGGIKSEVGLVSRDAPVDLAYNACDNLEVKRYDMLGYTVSAYADEAKVGGDRRIVFCISENPQRLSYCMGDALNSGDYLGPDQYLLSRNGWFAACYQSNRSNLVVYDLKSLNHAVWSTPAFKKSASRCGVNSNGEFLIQGVEDDIHWKASHAAPGGYVKLCNDGLLRMYNSENNPVWHS